MSLFMALAALVGLVVSYTVATAMTHRTIEMEARDVEMRVLAQIASLGPAAPTPSCKHRRVEPVESCVTGEWLAGICLDCNATIREGSMAGLRSQLDSLRKILA